MRKEIRKPLSFSTTMRNPERIASFMNCIKKFDGEMLNEELIRKIIIEVLKNKLYKTIYEQSNVRLKEIFYSDEKEFSNSDILEIIENSPQKHKEKGFDNGWESRFDTWYKLMKEFGFLYYKKGELLEISETGKILCEEYTEASEEYSGRIQSIFLNSLVKYQTNNLFRKNKNKNKPLLLLLHVIKLLKEDKNISKKYIYRKELPFFLCWRDNNYELLYKYILEFRKEFKGKATNEIIYSKCLELLESSNEKRFKFNQIVVEGVDDFIRKLRITGIISLRGMGRAIDFNSLKKEKIIYILEKYTEEKYYSCEKEYFNYIGKMDSNFLERSSKTSDSYDLNEIKQQALNLFSKKYSRGQIYKELSILNKGSGSKDLYLKTIDIPTRLEFLTSISLKQNFPLINIIPNYAIDDEGNPTFTARGGKADIEVYYKNISSLFEVTMMKNRNQSTQEIPSITRHLQSFEKQEYPKNCLGVFIAPFIHPDSRYMINFTKDHYNIQIIPFNIDEFVEKIENSKKLEDFLFLN